MSFFLCFYKKGPLNHQRARKNVRKAVSDGFSYCRTNLENSLCAKIDNQRDDGATNDISNGKVDEKSGNNEGPDKNSDKFENQLAKAMAKKCDDNEKKSKNEPEPDEIKPFVQETDVNITGTVVKKFGKIKTVHNVITPGELCKIQFWHLLNGVFVFFIKFHPFCRGT